MAKKEVKLDSTFFDRDSCFPCRNCRKHDSCIMKPREGKCTALEVGIPWSEQYSNSIVFEK